MFKIELIKQKKHRENTSILILNTIELLVLIYYSIENLVSTSELFSWTFCCYFKNFSSSVNYNLGLLFKFLFTKEYFPKVVDLLMHRM